MAWDSLQQRVGCIQRPGFMDGHWEKGLADAESDTMGQQMWTLT